MQLEIRDQFYNSLCRWDETGKVLGHKGSASAAGAVLQIGETDRVDFVISFASNKERKQTDSPSLRVQIGDFELSELLGAWARVTDHESTASSSRRTHNSIPFKAHTYFESACGLTRITVQRPDRTRTAGYMPILEAWVDVRSVKLGADGQRALMEDLASEEPSLLFGPGKSERVIGELGLEIGPWAMKGPRGLVAIFEGLLGQGAGLAERGGLLAYWRVESARAASMLRAEISEIETQKAERSLVFKEGQVSLYFRHDAPRVRALANLLDRMADIECRLAVLSIEDHPAVNGAGAAEVFSCRQVSEALLSARTVIKPSSQLFEQWLFFRIVSAFGSCDLSFGDWRESGPPAHGLGALKSGTAVTADFDRDHKVRISYEPTIHKGAAVCGSLFRKNGALALVPDIVVELIRETGGKQVTTAFVVLDAKFALCAGNSRWFDLDKKYSDIGAASDGAMRMLCMVLLGNNSLRSCTEPLSAPDPRHGCGAYTVRPDGGYERLELAVAPGRCENGMRKDDEAICLLAKHTLALFRREVVSRVA